MNTTQKLRILELRLSTIAIRNLCVHSMYMYMYVYICCVCTCCRDTKTCGKLELLTYNAIQKYLELFGQHVYKSWDVALKAWEALKTVNCKQLQGVLKESKPKPKAKAKWKPKPN